MTVPAGRNSRTREMPAVGATIWGWHFSTSFREAGRLLGAAGCEQDRRRGGRLAANLMEPSVHEFEQAGAAGSAFTRKKRDSAKRP